MHTFEFLVPGRWHVFPLHTLTFAWRFVVVGPCFIACDNPFKERLSFFTILPPKFYACFTHACLCSSPVRFGTHLAQCLWYPRSSCMMEYADPQLMSNLSSISVVVTCLSSWMRALIHSTLSAICEAFRWYNWSACTTLRPYDGLITRPRSPTVWIEF
jgi:hypothetical protein